MNGSVLKNVNLADHLYVMSVIPTANDKGLRKSGANVVRHDHRITLQWAEVAIPRALFAEILRRIDRLGRGLCEGSIYFAPRSVSQPPMSPSGQTLP